MVWQIEILESAAKEMKKLDKHIAVEIIEFIEKKLSQDPMLYSKSLKHRFASFRRLRMGDYRIVFRVLTEDGIIQITKIGHRKKVYDRL